MTKYMQKGSSYYVTDDANLIVADKLPVGTYAVKFSDLTGFFLETIESCQIAEKLYGDIAKKAHRILDTFKKRENSTGILLSGEKGCGKSLLAKLLSVNGAQQGYATLVVSTPYCGEAFNSFIQSITQPTIILFDEFEKVYKDKDTQEALLTLLDGVYSTKKLFVLTTNTTHGISNYMLNRPGRLFYHIEYKGISEDFIREYCADKKIKAADINSICAYSKAFEAFNFDMLQAIAEELNRYGEGLKEALSMLNIAAESFRSDFTPELTIDGKKPYWHTGLDEDFTIHPTQSFYIYWNNTKKEHDDESDESYTTFDMSCITKIDSGNYFFEKKTADGLLKLKLLKKDRNFPSYNKLALAA